MATSETPITALPAALMAQVEKLARDEQRKPEEVVQEAVERLLRSKRRAKLYAYGEGQVSRLGIQDSEVTDFVHQVRGVTERGR